MKDTPTRAFFPGSIVPALLVVLAAIQFATRSAYWPQRRGWLAVYTDGWRVSGTILFELGLASGFFAWFVLANDERREYLARPILIAAILVTIFGLALFGYGFFV